MKYTNKKVVFIVSAGRTATRFFGKLMQSYVEDCFSVHEPDMFYWGADESFLTAVKNVLPKIKTFGFYNMVVGRALGRTGMRSLGVRFLKGELTAAEAAKALLSERMAYYDSQNFSLIVESYYVFYALLPVIRLAFDQYRIAAIVRDPRTWVPSMLNKGGRHDAYDRPQLLFGQRRPDPELMGDQDYIDAWATMSPFQKNCWEWRNVYSLIWQYVQGDPNSKLFRFEDLFYGRDRDRELTGFLDFATTFGDASYDYDVQRLLGENPINAAKRRQLASWKDWPNRDCEYMHEACGSLMREFGYTNLNE